MLKANEVALLFKFYQRAQQYDGGGIYGDSLLEHIGFVDDLRAAILLGRLRKEGFVTQRGIGANNRAVYSVTAEGEAYIEGLIEGDDRSLDAALELIGSPSEKDHSPPPEQGEVADDEPSWSPLPIELAASDTKQLLKAANDAISTLQSDNGYAATLPVERAEVLSRLKAGVELLKDAPAISYSAIQVYFIWPVQKIARKFTPETVTGVAVKLFWDTLSGWVKKRGGDILDGIFK